jgi:hypothetical protein
LPDSISKPHNFRVEQDDEHEEPTSRSYQDGQGAHHKAETLGMYQSGGNADGVRNDGTLAFYSPQWSGDAMPELPKDQVESSKETSQDESVETPQADAAVPEDKILEQTDIAPLSDDTNAVDQSDSQPTEVDQSKADAIDLAVASQDHPLTAVSNSTSEDKSEADDAVKEQEDEKGVF